MKTSNKEKLIELLQSYLDYGIVKGGELCLPKEKALSFLNDLENIGVGVMGLDGWRYIDKSQGVIVQDLSVDETIDKTILNPGDTVKSSLKIAKEYISTKLPKEVDLISFTLDTPYRWRDLFPEPK